VSVSLLTSAFDNVTETTWVKATNTIYQGGGHASVLRLPETP